MHFDNILFSLKTETIIMFNAIIMKLFFITCLIPYGFDEQSMFLRCTLPIHEYMKH